MSSSCNCQCHENDPPSPRKNRKRPNTQSQLDSEIFNLENEIKEKKKNIPDFSELEKKLIQLENDVQNLSEEKLQIEYQLRQIDKGNGKIISDLEIENDNLDKEIKERNLMIEKLYFQNNNLYSILDNKTKDNIKIREKLIEQNEVLKRINDDRRNLENNLNNLNELKNQDFCDIQNLEAQIDILEKENMDNNNELNKLNEMNGNCINAINDEDCMRDKLLQIIKDKDKEIEEKAHELDLANQTLKRLANDLDNLNKANDENGQNINLYDEDLLKESKATEEIINKNQQLSDLINEKDDEINNFSNASDNQKNDLNYLNQEISTLTNKIEEYKQHIIKITDMNELLSKELEGIIFIDEQMRNNYINRAKYLKGLKEDNKIIINNSLKNLTTFMQNNGNKGCYIKAEKINEEKNRNNNRVIDRNKYYSFKDKENEEEENYEDQYSEDKD